MTHSILTRTALFLFSSAMLTSASYAANKVSSPEITKGKLEFEYRGGYDIDNRDSKDGNQQHKFLVNYGVTERLRPEIKAVFSNVPGDDVRFSAIEPGLRWQFFKKDEAWVSGALEGIYKLSTESHKPDKFESRLLLGKESGRFQHLANIAVEHELGADRRAGTAFSVAWKTKYRFTSYAEPGFEIHSDFGKLNDHLAYDEQKHQFGPTISGGIGEHFRYDIGYLFGVSDAAPDGRVKLILDYIVQF